MRLTKEADVGLHASGYELLSFVILFIYLSIYLLIYPRRTSHVLHARPPKAFLRSPELDPFSNLLL